jgi:hypothetical protein
LEFAKLLVELRPDLSAIFEDEKQHVAFFERELAKMVARGGTTASTVQQSARAWWKRLSRTLDRYLGDESFEPYRAGLRLAVLGAIEERSLSIGLLESRQAREHAVVRRPDELSSIRHDEVR